MAGKATLTPEALLVQFPPPVSALAEELRRFVQAQVPEAREAAYAGWRAIGYRHPRAGYLGGIFLFEDHVSVIFEHGHMLPDPERMLRGDTKQTRHITIAPGQPIPFGALTSLFEAAVNIGIDLRASRRTPG